MKQLFLRLITTTTTFTVVFPQAVPAFVCYTTFLPVSLLVGMTRLLSWTNDVGRKCLFWMLWLASIRNRTVAITTAAHIFLLSNMAGRPMEACQQGEGGVVERSVDQLCQHSCCHLYIFLRSVASPISLIFVKLNSRAVFPLVGTGSVVANRRTMILG